MHQALGEELQRQGWVGSVLGRHHTGSRSVPKAPLWLDHPTAFSLPALLMHFTPVVLEAYSFLIFWHPYVTMDLSDIKISKSHLKISSGSPVSQTLGLLFNDMNITYPSEILKEY